MVMNFVSNYYKDDLGSGRLGQLILWVVIIMDAVQLVISIWRSGIICSLQISGEIVIPSLCWLSVAC